MYELMFDLETLDTKPSAAVLSVGAVIWETGLTPEGELQLQVIDWFMRVLNLEEQFSRGRTVSQSTLIWWQNQNSVARAEAFNPKRELVHMVLNDFRHFVMQYSDQEVGDPGITAFWASPATFDFPIWEDLARDFSNYVPWTYRQKYDVRTVVREASYSAKDHQPISSLIGVAHTPVFDCEWQIDLLTAARAKLKRRMG
jgi:exodeoxyribonuclease VIII